MFSGLKSILFGYSDPVDTASLTTADANTGEPTGAGLSTDPSALLEQTLNAATIKLTEQLLPNSPSIEQIQSSSHQLLPTLNEQHEENEKRKQVEDLKEAKKEEDEEDDDECFIADSWELLDLVDVKSDATLSTTATVQDENLKILTGNVKTSGILKQSKTKLAVEQQLSGDQRSQQQRQKPKVSFEAPDLVREEQKIEPIITNGGSSKNSKKSKSKNNKRNKKATVVPVGILEKQEESLCTTSKSASKSGAKFELEPQSKAVSKPVLNYAAALSMKLVKDEKSANNESNATKATTSMAGEVKDSEEKKLQASGAVKRNRPVSTSSWSSSDEIEAIDFVWNESQTTSSTDVVGQEKMTEYGNSVTINNDNDDNDSIISSEFSDCDYGYHGLNDFIMRPKKSHKKRGNSTTSSGLLGSMAKRGERFSVPSDTTISKKSMQTSVNKLKQKQNLSNETTEDSWNLASASSSKQTKPKKKKKKIVVSDTLTSALTSSSASISGYLKKNPAPEPSANFAVPKAALNETFLKPSSPASSQSNNLIASSFSGNDSSDVAEMDESWYVTPPPCFTGSNKLNKPKPARAKEAARENALIEHPSIYIAETSKQQLEAVACANSLKPLDVINQEKNTLKQIKDLVETKKGKKKLEKQIICKVKESKREKTENKFIVANWPDDEQDDLNDDFDNLFEPIQSSSKHFSFGKSKKKNNKQQFEHKKSQLKPLAGIRVDSPAFLDDFYTGYESDDFSTLSPALVGLTDNSTNINESIEMVPQTPIQLEPEVDVEVVQKENMEPELVEEDGTIVEPRRRTKSMSEKKPPVVVEPILPERQPGWQLRKKRNKRRQLVVASASTGNLNKLSSKTGVSNQQQVSNNSSCFSSARSSPSNLIDRIGQSIVTNLTNLTSGFPGTQPTMPLQAHNPMEEVEKLNQAVARKTTAEINLGTRRSLSKSHLNRQNDCVKVANSNRRADRRLKMHTKPNGVSLNRKVHTSIH